MICRNHIRLQKGGKNKIVKMYVYVRDNEWYRLHRCYKVGIAEFLKNRESTYITGEPIRGEFIHVVEIVTNKHIFDRKLKIHLKKHQPKNINGGTEFYNRSIYKFIIEFLQISEIDYKELTNTEINLLNRKNSYTEIKPYDNITIQQQLKQLAKKKVLYSNLQPYNYQQDVLNKIEEFYNNNNKGKIIWACGLGKALLSIFIIQLLHFKSVVFGVPNNELQKQIKNEILKIFPNKNNILFVGRNKVHGIKTTTDINIITQFINNTQNTEPIFIISTYHSCHLLNGFHFDFKIGDETHHLVGTKKEEEKGFRLFHNIVSTKSLFMTATEKNVILRTIQDKEVFSMDDKTMFGDYIDIKTVNWAIEKKHITDYNIIVLKNTEDEVDDILNSLGMNNNSMNKKIFISCYMCLKGFEKYSGLTHLLLYTNTIEDAKDAEKYINEILKSDFISIPNRSIYRKALHSGNSKGNILNTELDNFKRKPYGIIPCVFLFGEGFDLPKLNGVCIAGNMQSEIRIVQYLLRPNRLEKGNPNKRAFVIIPFIDMDDWSAGAGAGAGANSSYDTLKNIIFQMRNIDENIEQKIKVFVKGGKKDDLNGGGEDGADISGGSGDTVGGFIENENELQNIKLRLRYSKALCSNFTEEQDEYNYVCLINKKMDLQSYREYVANKNRHCNFIDNPEEYFRKKGVWENLYHFLGVDTRKFIQSKQDWINFCKTKQINSVDDYNIFCERYDSLPKEPAELYKDFSTISAELEIINTTSKRRRTPPRGSDNLK